MHVLFETNQVIQHLGAGDPLLSLNCAAVSDIRIGMALMCLAADRKTALADVKGLYERLERAERNRLLQIFFDDHGLRRGYAILAKLDDASDAEGRLDPIKILRDVDRHAGGNHAWLVKIGGGLGQGRAIARNLRDNFLMDHDRLTYLRARRGELLLKTMSNNGAFGFGQRRILPQPATGARFEQFRLRSERAADFCHYARLAAGLGSGSVSLATAMDRFTHPTALQQFCFGQGNPPDCYVSWAMIDDDVLNRIEAEPTRALRPSDWNSGRTAHIIEALGDAKAVERVLADQPKAWGRPLLSSALSAACPAHIGPRRAE